MASDFMKIIFIILLFVLIFPRSLQAANTTNDECVMLVHGLGRTKLSMLNVEFFLEDRGYEVINFAYPSTEYKIQTLANKYLKEEIEKIATDTRIHFVTHSLGGIMVRYYLNHKKLDNLGRVVMLSPPNQGSEVADTVADFKIVEWTHGPVVEQLQTEDDFLQELGPVDFEVGVITGNRSYNIINSFLIPGEDDGKVAIENAKITNMQDFLVVPRSHTFIMNSEYVLHQITNFLDQGKFNDKLSETEYNSSILPASVRLNLNNSN